MVFEIKRIGNVQQFIEAHTRYAQRLAQDGVVFDSPIPEALRPLVRSTGPWPGTENWLWPYLNPEGRGRAIGPIEKAPLGAFDMYGVMAKPPFEVAGHSFRISQKEDFRNGEMSNAIAAEKLQRPSREWNSAIAHELFNVATAGAFEAGSAVRTPGYVFTVENFKGVDIAIEKPTETASIASATIANANHLVQWPDRRGGQFGAGHDHLPANVGGPWTEALGRLARDHLLEHPGVSGVDALIGKNVVEDVFAVMKDAATYVAEAVRLAREGTATESSFGNTSPVGVHEGVRYLRSDDLPADLALYYARGSRPIALTVGVQFANKTELPYSWNDLKNMDPEVQTVNYGYRGQAAAQVVEPTKLFIHNYV